MTEQRIVIARSALTEITRPETIGELLGEVVEENGTVTVRFASALPGYPGWAWTVSLAEPEGETPSVLETELMPGDGALLAPDWVPWSERLADYKAAQDALEADAAESDDDEDDDDLDDDQDDDDSDDDDSDEELDEDDVLGNDVLHGGDLDGVDIDGLAGDDESDDDDDDDDDDSDDDGSDDDEGAERTY